jgi:hypothetical protein
MDEDRLHMLEDQIINALNPEMVKVFTEYCGLLEKLTKQDTEICFKPYDFGPGFPHMVHPNIRY